MDAIAEAAIDASAIDSSPAGQSFRWTDGEKHAFLLQTIYQLRELTNSPLRFDKYNLPGRTPRALMNQWARVRAESQASMDAGPVITQPLAPKATTARCGNYTKTNDDDSEDEPRPKKRKLPPRQKKNTTIRKEEMENTQRMVASAARPKAFTPGLVESKPMTCFPHAAPTELAQAIFEPYMADASSYMADASEDEQIQKQLLQTELANEIREA